MEQTNDADSSIWSHAASWNEHHANIQSMLEGFFKVSTEIPKKAFMLDPERTMDTLLGEKSHVMLSDTLQGKDPKPRVVLLFSMQRCLFDLKCLNNFIFMPKKHHKDLHGISIADLEP